jgi:hypothetical protein
VEVLAARKQLCLMPEGGQGDQHKLQPLVKGLFRIAYAAEERLNGAAHVKIVPVGIDYSYYQHAGADLVLTYGKPIEIKDFLPIYQESPANGLNVLREELAGRLSGLMHDIRSNDRYDMIYRLCCYGTTAYLEMQMEKGLDFHAKTMAGLRFDARFALGKILDSIDEENPGQILELDALCRQMNTLPGFPTEVAEWMESRQSNFQLLVWMIATLPLLPGILMNFPAWGINWILCRKIDDTQMHCTFAFTIGIIVNGLTYLAVTMILGGMLGYSFLQSILAFIFITALGLVSERVRQSMRLPFWRFLHLFGAKKRRVEESKKEYLKLKAAMIKILGDRI